jgi:hypothetical protein
MKNLYNFILEAESVDLKFINAVNSLDDLKKEKSGLNIFNEELVPKKVVDEFKNKLDQFTKSNRSLPSAPFMFASGANYFKMSYCYNDFVDGFDGKDGFYVAENGIKRSLYYKPSGVKTRSEYGVKLMETGNGSLDKVPTEVQENATCVVFNAYMDVFSNTNSPTKNNPFNKVGDIENMEVIKNVISDLVSEIDESWVISFSHQVKTIISYLRRLGISYKTISNYRLARYGANSEEEPVSTAYSNMIKEYSKFMGGRKDAYDPTDVLLFNKEKVNEIIKCCNWALDEINSKDPDRISAAKVVFLKNIFKEKFCMGISLKKLHRSGKVELFNVNGKEDVVENVTGFENIPPKHGNYIQLRCYGSFKFKEGFTDGDGDKLNNVKEVTLTLRTFGGDNAYIDVNIPGGGPAIGKCPADTWRGIIYGDNETIKTDLESCKKQLNKFLGLDNTDTSEDKNNKKIYTDETACKGLLNIIKGAVKEGPSCFPFILLH